MLLLTAYYVIFHMSLLFPLWRTNKYRSINQSINTLFGSMLPYHARSNTDFVCARSIWAMNSFPLSVLR